MEHDSDLFHALPVNAGALDAEQDAQIDAGPARVGLPTVTALLVSRQTQDTLQNALAPAAALSGLVCWVDTADGGRSGPVQTLQTDTQNSTLLVAIWGKIEHINFKY